MAGSAARPAVEVADSHQKTGLAVGSDQEQRADEDHSLNHWDISADDSAVRERADAGQIRLRLQHARQHALGDDLDARAPRNFRVETDAQAEFPVNYDDANILAFDGFFARFEWAY